MTPDPPPLPLHSATVIDWRWRDHVINTTVAATPLGPLINREKIGRKSTQKPQYELETSKKPLRHCKLKRKPKIQPENSCESSIEWLPEAIVLLAREKTPREKNGFFLPVVHRCPRHYMQIETKNVNGLPVWPVTEWRRRLPNPRFTRFSSARQTENLTRATTHTPTPLAIGWRLHSACVTVAWACCPLWLRHHLPVVDHNFLLASSSGHNTK